MSIRSAVSAGALVLLLGIITPLYAQHEQEHGGQGKPAGGAAQHQQAAPKQAAPKQAAPKQAAPQHRQAQARTQPSYGGAYHGGVRPNGAVIGGVHHSGVPQNAGQVRSGFVQSRAQSWNADHRTWAQRGGYNGYRIPDARFRQYWGHDHFFVIGRLPLVFVGGFPRFQYDGYWVTFVDPWPDTWPATWYETDNVYVDYTSDGYYLYDLTRPGPVIAVTIAF